MSRQEVDIVPPVGSDDSNVVVINVFSVDPARQDELVELLANAMNRFVRVAEGFESARLHRGIDGTKVTMVGHWRSYEAYKAMPLEPDAMAYLGKALCIATVDAGLYEGPLVFERSREMSRTCDDRPSHLSRRF